MTTITAERIIISLIVTLVGVLITAYFLKRLERKRKTQRRNRFKEFTQEYNYAFGSEKFAKAYYPKLNKAIDKLKEEPLIVGELRNVFKSISNNVPSVMSGRPDLSFITKQEFECYMEYVDFYKSLNTKEKYIFENAKMYIPALIEIAEMYHDSMLGTPQEKSLNFQIVRDTLNKIAGVNN